VRDILQTLHLTDDGRARIEKTARRLVECVRSEQHGKGGIDAFLHQYGLSTQEGVLLMCIAEALLRVPDDETQERLIRDKISAADWERHLGKSDSLFVNASTWALMLTGRIVRMHGYAGQTTGGTVRRLVARLGEPVVREAVNQAMRIMGRQFVMGRNIADALDRARALESRGYCYSYDMLGEAARTMADASRYFDIYRGAIAAIGTAAAGRGVKHGPGISVKLSALHPRFEVAKAKRVMDELVPRVQALARNAAGADIGMTIDMEEADRLDITLDVLEAVSGDTELAGWDGLGIVVQTYQKRAPFMIDWLADMARRHDRRLMVRLVKGAYWDAEIKRSQELGLDGYPVFTRKVSTDVCYLACARHLFENRDAFYPQFATHNAHSIAAVLEFAGDGRDFEFQRLHGMGEELYKQAIEKDKVGVGCRIYAPVGEHEELLAYLVRRLLENGANSSFVNRIQDEKLPMEEIIADPVTAVRGLASIPHPRIPQPVDLYGGERRNSRGIDLNDRAGLSALARAMDAAANRSWTAGPIIAGNEQATATRDVVSPADRGRVIGRVAEATADDVEDALAAAARTAGDWACLPVDERAACLDRAADLMEAETAEIMALCVLEAGKTINDAVAEVREAVDFCRYYAHRARDEFARSFHLHVPAGGAPQARLRGGGVFCCISPWNFPLAIFMGQVTAALAAGNTVVAKPAEQTPLVAAHGVRLLHRAGVPGEVLHLLPGDGATVGGALVADTRVNGVVFTGSTEVAQLINRTLARRAGAIVPLVAETGGQNVMIVDSTALPEQVTRDVLASAFQSAGQRCSALRILCLQEDVADGMIEMLAGAMEELSVGDPSLLSTDIGPVIDEEAQAMLQGHAKRMLGEAKLIKRAHLGPGTGRGSFVAPVAFEIDRISRLQREVFGPILHVVRYRADHLDNLIEAVNDTGYGLTLGIHSRIDETADRIYSRTKVGNTYVNRNQIGAIVGVQPFGGQGLSGTGPKAGGPHYLHRFAAEAPANGTSLGAAAEVADVQPGNVDDIRLDRSGLEYALTSAVAAMPGWAATEAGSRAAVLEQAADACEGAADELAALHADGAGAVTRVVEYLDFYAAQVRSEFAGPERLPGPTGERNELSLHPRGVFACLCQGGPGLAAFVAQIGAALAAGNAVVAWHPDGDLAARLAAMFKHAGLPDGALMIVPSGLDTSLADMIGDPHLAGVAFAGPRGTADAINRTLATSDGPIRPLVLFAETPAEGAGLGNPLSTGPRYLHRFTHERTLSVDTTASGGNASLLSLDEDQS
jgi:RHH-type proline utilization regulon transcriptional repressor/proline dehydrogenase/delta 1-pyrroline-5-carboxylate dehydrogenase